MKLRNKATQEVWNIPEWRTPAVQEGDICFFAELNGEGKLFSYKSLDELNKEWEDYTPAEPLIKDEKVRNAVRVWADVVGTNKCTYDRFWETFSSMDTAISFGGVYKFELEDEKNYTIAELCGEEEE